MKMIHINSSIPIISKTTCVQWPSSDSSSEDAVAATSLQFRAFLYNWLTSAAADVVAPPVALSDLCFFGVSPASCAGLRFPNRGVANAKHDKKRSLNVEMSFCAQQTSSQVTPRQLWRLPQWQSKIQANHAKKATHLVALPCHMLHSRRALLQQRRNSAFEGII